MKDEHDKSTIDLVQQAAHVPQVGVKTAAKGVTHESAIYAAQQRLRQKMESWLPVSTVARDFCLSTRRIRVLLNAGRIEGRQVENGYWEVLYPYQVTFGKRGPKPFASKAKKLEQAKAESEQAKAELKERKQNDLDFWRKKQEQQKEQTTMKTLTGGRKIMNIAKLGIVSRSLKICLSVANPLFMRVSTCCSIHYAYLRWLVPASRSWRTATMLRRHVRQCLSLHRLNLIP